MQEPIIEVGKDFIYPLRGQGGYIIRETDLRRLEKMVARIDQRGGFYQNMGFGGLGGVIGTATALIGLSTTQHIATWCWSLCWAILAVSFALMVIGFVASYHEGQNLQVPKQAIQEGFQVIRASVDAPVAVAAAAAVEGN